MGISVRISLAVTEEIILVPASRWYVYSSRLASQVSTYLPRPQNDKRKYINKAEAK